VTELVVFVEGQTEEQFIRYTLAVESIGLAKIRSRCPRFHDWVSGLEALGQG
jgi:hypothetical protein